MDQGLVIYEQPVSELVRVSLRLEHLFKQIDYYYNCLTTSWHSRDIIKAIVDILNLLDRPDLKSKFSQEYLRLIKVFSKLPSSPEISQSRLQNTLTDLKTFSEYFIQQKSKLALPLREQEFIANIKLHLNTPGGDCCSDIPAFYYWLQLPIEAQKSDVDYWLKHLEKIKQAITLYLNLLRHSAEPISLHAEQGYYHTPLNATPASQLIRIGLTYNIGLYPETSVGKHRMNIRFLEPGNKQRARQTQKPVPFKLTICNL